MGAGAIYLVFALLIKLIGMRFIDRLFPPVVRGVGIAIIGLNLATSAIDNIQNNNGFAFFTPGYYWTWVLALLTCLTAVLLSSYGKGMFKMALHRHRFGHRLCCQPDCNRYGYRSCRLMNLSAIGTAWLD